MMETSKQSTQSQYEFASFSRRFGAVLIDSFILGIINIAYYSLIGTTIFEIADNPPQSLTHTIISNGMPAIFYIAFWIFNNGQTPGKKLMNIRIIKENNEQITFMSAAVRYIGYFISGILLLLGFLWMLWDKKKQTIHDKMASTIVVKVNNNELSILAKLLIALSILSVIFYSIAAVRFSIKKYKTNTLDSQIKESFNEDPYKTNNKQVRQYLDESADLFNQMQMIDRATEDKDQLAKNYIEIGKLNDQNIAVLEKAKEIEPTNAYVWYNLGNAYTWENSRETTYQDSYEMYKKAAELEPQNAGFITSMADMLYQETNYEEAVLTYNEALRVDANYWTAQMGLGLSYKALNINDKARIHLEAALKTLEKNNMDGVFDKKILSIQQELASIEK